MAKEILISKLQALITGSASVSDAAIRQEFAKQNTKVKFDYAVLKEDDIKKGLHPTNEELKALLRQPSENLCELDSREAQDQVCRDRQREDSERSASHAATICRLITISIAISIA